MNDDNVYVDSQRVNENMKDIIEEYDRKYNALSDISVDECAHLVSRLTAAGATIEELGDIISFSKDVLDAREKIKMSARCNEVLRIMEKYKIYRFSMEEKADE